MKRNDLKQYRDLLREIEVLERRIEKANDKVTDTVKGSSSSYPFIERNIIIEGQSPRKERYIRRLQKRKRKAEELQEEIEEFIAQIPDSRTRQIFEQRYIMGKSWRAISLWLRSTHESYARNIHDRYLQRLKS